MSKKSEIAFATWCSKRKVAFMGVPFTRKRSRDSFKRYRKLYVMKNEFRDGIIEAITTSIPRYQKHLNHLKEQGCSIIGYARKSLGSNNDEESRKRLLNSMVECLKERSLCDMVFVSWSCSAASKLASRDMNNKPDMIKELIGVDGDNQSMISHINSSKKDICLVATDFAGLSTNVNDLQNFFTKHKRIAAIIIDSLLEDSKFHEFKAKKRPKNVKRPKDSSVCIVQSDDDHQQIEKHFGCPSCFEHFKELKQSKNHFRKHHSECMPQLPTQQTNETEESQPEVDSDDKSQAYGKRSASESSSLDSKAELMNPSCLSFVLPSADDRLVVDRLDVSAAFYNFQQSILTHKWKLSLEDHIHCAMASTSILLLAPN